MSHNSVVPYWVLSYHITPQVFLSLFPEYVEIILSYSVSDPIKYHVYCFGFFFLFYSRFMFAGVFSVAAGVGGCEWLVSAREVCIDVVFWEFSNNPPNSD